MLMHVQNPGPLILQDFEPLEASLRAHARSKNLGPFIVQGFQPLEASLRTHACSKNQEPSIDQDFDPLEAFSCMLTNMGTLFSECRTAGG